MAFEDFKDLARRTASYKVLRDKAFSIAKNPKYDEYQRVHTSTVTIFLIKKPQVVVLNNEMKEGHQLAQELYKPIINNFEK